jgi:hypothetical protein
VVKVAKFFTFTTFTFVKKKGCDMKKGMSFSEIPTPPIVQKDDGGGKEIEAERTQALLSNSPAPPDEGVSVWLDFLISNFKEIKWRDDAPKEMRDRAFELIVYYDKMKRARKTRSEFRALIDKGFKILNSMRTRLGLEPF